MEEKAVMGESAQPEAQELAGEPETLSSQQCGEQVL